MDTKNRLEQIAWKKNLHVCGIDEAGRGCLSGPLVVAAVVLPPNTKNNLLLDSKIMTEAERNSAYSWIVKHCFFSTVFIDVHTIETRNIYQTTRFAMKKAYIQLIETIPFSHQKIQYLITDAMPLTPPQSYRHPSLEIYSPPHAESLSATVAAASIVAKVTRDRLLKKLAPLFPKFSLEQHKGYGTKKHKQALTTYGTTIIHRPSFVLTATQKRKDHGQQTIC
ncbi:ribonuclease HII [Candidatus Dependentiae bacterium]|nr:ribonuclease HII [Candidatus Dependentiae bacterium]